MIRVIFAPEADADMESIWAFIGRDSVDAADRVVERLFERCHELVAAPKQGRPRPDLMSGARSVPCTGFVIVYRARRDELRILRIIHGARDIDAMFNAE